MDYSNAAVGREAAQRYHTGGAIPDLQERTSYSYITDSVYTNYSNNISEELSGVGEMASHKVVPV